MSVLRLRSDALFWRESGEEVVALDGEAERYLAVSESGAWLWKQLATGTTADELASALCDRYGITPEVAQHDVAAFVEQLSSRGLLAAEPR